ncbi:MAG: pyrroline-5-carboxylate reductase [Alphaproteobacteria bacterium]|nr:MAG: pyrroline-5-carboxylate reductase [Alphaproteobacteria bacterium]
MIEAINANSPLILVGCGHMGHAMAVGWLSAGLAPEALYVVDPHANPGVLPALPAGHFVEAVGLLPRGLKPRALVIAVKPQIIDSVLPLLTPFATEDTLVISIAAGITLSHMKEGIGADALYVRTMPNTPAAVGAGITGMVAGAGLSEDDRHLVQRLLDATGQSVWIADEDQMNTVTAVSGSGPAYVFHLIECMAAAGVEEGLPEDVAMRLARQTIVGAARLLDVEADVPVGKLRDRVTSPGGTTAAALKVLMHDGDGLAALMFRAVAAARLRGEELGG